MNDKSVGTAKLKTYIDITRITIVICWIALFAFWAIKLFGGNFFEIVVQNESFIKFSNIVQNTSVKYLVSFFTMGLANYLLIGAICQKFYFKGNEIFIVSIAIISIWIVANFVPMGAFKFPSWYGYLVLILFGLIYQKKWKKSFGFLAIVLEMIFTVISFITRNYPISITSNYFFGLILSIDLYIMYALYYLYSNLIKNKGEQK